MHLLDAMHSPLSAEVRMHATLQLIRDPLACAQHQLGLMFTDAIAVLTQSTRAGAATVTTGSLESATSSSAISTPLPPD